MRPDVALAAGSSPHTRGAPPGPCALARALGIIPAYAGSTAFASSHFALSTDHPRIRGEHALMRPDVALAAGSSPHTRGAPPGPCALARALGIIPAYAGSTAGHRPRGGCPADHPRIRGEHSRRRRIRTPLAGSSPHTRGAPPWRGSGPFGIRIIPAYAGSTNTWRTTPPSTPDHPRIRGEHPRST